MQFFTAVMFRRAMTQGGLYSQMMPGAFETAEAAVQGVATYKKLDPEWDVFVPVKVTLGSDLKPVSVEPIAV